MSIPRCDVQLLRTLRSQLAQGKLAAYKPSRNRAACALVLRFKGNSGVKVARCFSAADRGISVDGILDRLELHADGLADSELTLMFLRKKYMMESRWSGVIAFPGGKRDHDDRDDFDCAVRWCNDTLGMPINTPDFVVLGRLPDFHVYSRVMGQGLMMARFVVLHIGELTPSVKLAHHDIQAITWAPLQAFDEKWVTRRAEQHHFFSYFVGHDYQEFVEAHFPNVLLRFPSIPMPGGFGSLWGMTLTSTSTLLGLAGRKRLDWPLFDATSKTVQFFFVDALHGYMEWTKAESAETPRLRHKVALGTIVSLAVCFVVYWVSYAAVILQAIQVVSDPEEQQRLMHERMRQNDEVAYFKKEWALRQKENAEKLKTAREERRGSVSFTDDSP